MIISRVVEADGGVALSPAVPLTDAKAHLNVLHATDDGVIQGFVETAQQHLEGPDGCGGVLGRAVVRHVLELSLPRFGGRVIDLPQPPLVSVSSVNYLDTTGALQTLDPSVWRELRNVDRGSIALNPGKAWPGTFTVPDAVRIRFTCGYETVPAPLRNAILLHVGHLYLNRDGEMDRDMPASWRSLISPYLTHGWI